MRTHLCYYQICGVRHCGLLANFGIVEVMPLDLSGTSMGVLFLEHSAISKRVFQSGRQ